MFLRRLLKKKFTSVARWQGAVLIIALLFTRSAVLQHEVDFKAHQGVDACGYCLHTSTLKHGAVEVFASGVLDGAATQFENIRALPFPFRKPASVRARSPPGQFVV
jgi:hypothetical protein